jgi:phosphoribosylglycinamide formyltransferase-1
MWGRRVHEAVLAAGAAASRATYHIVDEEYDHGPVIYEVPVPVLPDDDAVALETRVIEAQHQSLIPFVTAWARGQIKAPALAGRASEGTTD